MDGGPLPDLSLHATGTLSPSSNCTTSRRPSAASRRFVVSTSRSHAGEIHGLVGENGAGKSTLMKIIAGVHADFSGRFVLDGKETRFRSVRDAHAAGIAMVHQELSVAPDLSVAENVFLGTQPTNRFGLVQWRRMAREAGEQLQAVRHRRRSDVAARRPADRPAAADRDRPRAVLGRPHHHPRRADLGAVAAGSRAPVRDAATAAGRRHQHRLHLAFHRGHSARLRHRDRVPQRPEGRRDRGGRDQQGRR